MQKSRTKLITLASYACACLFAYTNCTSLTFAGENQDVLYVTSADTKKNTLFSSWIKSKNKINASSESAKSGEIWGRIRGSLSLSTSNSSPLLQRHLKNFSNSQDYINKVVKNASPYLYYILEEVEKRGMPSEIALLPIIESDFNPQCTSHKGAAGLWQIMPSLGKLHGLKQNSSYDGRRDVYESTKVALDHLAYLHKKFNGNWLLALAAYNSGETKVQRAIKNNRSAKKGTDFWSLKLPKETTHFVPKLLAFAAIIKSPNQYGVVLPAIPNQPVFARINVGKSIDISHAAKLVDVSETQLRRLNPGHKKSGTGHNGPSHLLVPIHQAENIKAKINKEPTSKASNAKIATPVLTTTSVTHYRVKPGDNINKIAKKFHTTPSAIKELNHLKTDIIAIGKSLEIPAQALPTSIASKEVLLSATKAQKHSSDTEVTLSKQPKVHIVKKGESIPSISKKHKIKVKTLLANNGLKSASSIIQPGQRLIISES